MLFGSITEPEEEHQTLFVSAMGQTCACDDGSGSLNMDKALVPLIGFTNNLASAITVSVQLCTMYMCAHAQTRKNVFFPLTILNSTKVGHNQYGDLFSPTVLSQSYF